MDLGTSYLGLHLRSPIVASAGPSTSRIDSLRELEEAGVGAVVLPSLFEEQVDDDELATTALFDTGTGTGRDAVGYFPDLDVFETVVDRYLRHVEEARRALGIPVIASLNGTSPGGWARYARLLQDAGADALELNLYRVAANIDTPGAQVEAEQHELVKAVAGALFVPLAVKVGPYYSAFANFAAGLVDAGADALVLFNRFYQPDLSPVTRQVAPALDPSTSSELRLGLHWLSLLHGRVDADLAATTGIRTGLDVAKALLAGASVAMMTSALLGNGPGHVRAVEDELIAWATGHGYASVAQLRGSASQRHVTDPDAFERASYIEGLVDHSNAFARTEDPWHAHVRR